jgi:hypothetical protein
MMLSRNAAAVIRQLKRGDCWDGDLISKSGRDELVKRGIAQRCRKYEDGPYEGCMINELTSDGLKLATVMAEVDAKVDAYDSAPTDPHHGGKIWKAGGGKKLETVG